MGRIDRIFQDCRTQGRKPLMPFVVAGDPSLERLGPTLAAMEAAGAAIVEIGIPFSDPIADGPVIAEAMHRALQRGVTPDAVMEVVRQARASLRMGLVAMVSVSIVDRCGGPAFVERLAAAGFDGLIVPDADLEAVEPLVKAAERLDMAFAMLVAPTTTDARLHRLLDSCRGFVYLLARAGITGERQEAPEVEALVARVRRHTRLPLAVGFGISTAEHVQAVCRHADAAIVGSSLVRRMAAGEDAGTVVRGLLA
ncbi:MAG: tryptophan synthase subunit alpha [Planctomycetes bacterium]|nr:tryptophan synthase subunit alpha [Planctomycetota bacterium]